MIITAARNTPVSVGVTESVDYKIDTANLGHIASILRKAYSDPIRAVVREYGTNAAEAHMLNGNTTKPFAITLPTSMSPTFKIRDFGPGLGTENFKDLFCSYGGSSKRTSNQFTGCLGIGCKSYGSYSDSCTVTDVHDGVKRIWNCFIDESEVGKASLLSETKSNEPSGVEVSVAVRPNDVDRFRNTAIKVYKVFDLPPSISNLTADEKESYAKIDHKEGSVKGDNWVFRGDGNSWLQMGLVLYPLKSDFSGPAPIRKLIDAGVYVRVELGDVQIAPSREDLQYSQKTIQSLVKYLNPILDKLGEELVSAVQNAPNFIEAHKVLKQFNRGDYNSSDFRQSIIDKHQKKLVWRNNPIDTNSTIELAQPLKNAKGEVVSTAEEVFKSHNISLLRISKRSWGKSKFNVEREDVRIHVSSDMQLFLNDGKVKGSGEARAKHFIQTGNTKTDCPVYVLSYRNGGGAFLQSTLPWFDGSGFRDIDELPNPPPAVKTVDANGDPVATVKDARHGKGKVFVLASQMANSHDYKKSDNWNITNLEDKDQIVVYTVLDKFQHNPGPSSSKLTPYLDEYHSLFTARHYLKSIGFSEHIYGVKVGDVDAKVGRNWMTVADAIEEATKAFLAANPDKAQQIADRIAAKDYFGSRNCDTREQYKKFGTFFRREELTRWCESTKGVTRLDDLDKQSPFRLFMQKLSTMLAGLTTEDETKLPMWLQGPRANWRYGRADTDKSGSAYKTLLSLLPKPSYDLKQESLEVVKRYPLLITTKGPYQPRTEPSDAMKDASEATVQYLRLVDAAHKKT
jgi:hypothetical protein